MEKINEPTPIAKMAKTCAINCKHRTYCEYHKDREHGFYPLKPKTKMKDTAKEILWMCMTFMIDKPLPLNPR